MSILNFIIYLFAFLGFVIFNRELYNKIFGVYPEDSDTLFKKEREEDIPYEDYDQDDDLPAMSCDTCNSMFCDTCREPEPSDILTCETCDYFSSEDELMDEEYFYCTHLCQHFNRSDRQICDYHSSRSGDDSMSRNTLETTHY